MKNGNGGTRERGNGGTGERCSFFSGEKKEPKKSQIRRSTFAVGEAFPWKGKGDHEVGDEVD